MNKILPELIFNFLCHIFTISMSIYFLSLARDYNGEMAWILVIFLMCRIIIIEDFSKLRKYLAGRRLMKFLSEKGCGFDDIDLSDIRKEEEKK